MKMHRYGCRMRFEKIEQIGVTIMNKRRKIITKKTGDMMLIILFVFAVVFLFGYLGHVIIDMYWKDTIGTAGNIVFIILGILFLLNALITIFFQLAHWVQNVTVHVKKYQGAKCFEEIDSYIGTLEEYNDYYRSVIFEVNKIYETNQELKQLIDTQNLETLYTRKTYLENNLDLYNNIIQLVAALAISGIVAFAQGGVIASNLPTSYRTIIICILLFFCFTLRYYTKGQGDSYKYNLYDYELKLLSEKIYSVNKQLRPNEDIEKILHLRQTINNMLINLYKNRKKRSKSKLSQKNIEEMRKTLYELPLLSELAEADIIWAKLNICESEEYFPLIIDAGQYKFLSKSYEKIYEILQKLKSTQ